MTFCVYKHTTPSQKVYIGITSRIPAERWANGHGYHHNKHFSEAIKKYGWDNISHEVLYENLTKEEAECLEIKLIKELKCDDRRFGYNISKGGSVVRLGLKHTAETKRKISDKGKGRKMSKEHCDKQSKRLKGRIPYWCIPYAHSEAVEEKRRKTRLERGTLRGLFVGEKSARAKRVNMFTLAGDYVKSFGALSDAQRETGVDYGSIVKVCRGQRKSAGGYYWQYSE